MKEVSRLTIADNYEGHRLHNDLNRLVHQLNSNLKDHQQALDSAHQFITALEARIKVLESAQQTHIVH